MAVNGVVLMCIYTVDKYEEQSTKIVEIFIFNDVVFSITNTSNNKLKLILKYLPE